VTPIVTAEQRAILSIAALYTRGGERWCKLDRHTIFTGPGTEPLEQAGYRSTDEGLRDLALFPGDQAALGFHALNEADGSACGRSSCCSSPHPTRRNSVQPANERHPL
jgi:hypothetical protein